MSTRRVLRACLLGLAGLVAVVVGLVGGIAELTLPSHSGTLRLPGLHSRVEVAFDRHAIPCIKASNDVDAAETLGFLHARDRMLQMDLMRRAAAGTLSALIGPAALRLDETARILGTEAAAEASLAALSPPTRRLLDAYAAGVNAFITRRGRWAAPEYLLFGKPAPWRPVDSLLWAETMGLALSDNMSLELARLALSARMPRDRILSFWPNGSPPEPVDQAWRAPADLARLAALTLSALPRFPAPFTLPNTASNEWAVDGSHTRDGAPLLAGDPHLGYGLPCLWYLARIETPSGFAMGATAPGTPFVVLGQNAHIAWTFTTTGADTEDLFIEHPLDADHYQSPSGPLAFAHRRERIAVAGRPDVLLDVRVTRHGPVISDLPRLFGLGSVPRGTIIAADIASLAPDNTAADGLRLLDAARDVTQAGSAAATLTAPVQNLLVADRHRIALLTTGRVPIRRSGDGRTAVDGADGAHDWIGFASGDALPHIVSPASGILVNANEPVTGTGSTAAIAADPYADWRARRIRTLLDGPDHAFTPEDFAAMQGDVTSAYDADLLPLLRATTPADERSRAALNRLAGWNGAMRPERPEPLIVHAWLSRIDAGLNRLTDGGLSAAAPLTYRRAALRGEAPGCRPSCGPLLTRTLRDSMAQLASIYGNDVSRWRWGSAHRAVFANPLWQQIPILRALLEASLPVGGDASTVDAQAALSAPPFDAVHGASYRGVYDLADPDRSLFIIATGESGNPFSGHLLDFSRLWERVATVTIHSRAGDGSRLTLSPEP